MTQQTETTVADTATQVINTTASIKEWFALAVPEPTDKNRAVQLGVHFEEVGEMLDTLHGVSSDDLARLATRFKLNDPYAHLSVKSVATPDERKALLDALCDQIVTAIGVAHMFGMDVVGALAEVNSSNYSKFKDGKPLFDANGKITKNPDTYHAPDLTPFV